MMGNQQIKLLNVSGKANLEPSKSINCTRTLWCTQLTMYLQENVSEPLKVSPSTLIRILHQSSQFVRE